LAMREPPPPTAETEAHGEIEAIEDQSGANTVETAGPVERVEGQASGPSGDRGFRGDRRGRRSRRRRSRNGGFPENKYAQPGQATVQPRPESTREETTAAENETDQSDARPEVLLLPGESLAKYRRVPVWTGAAETRTEQLTASEEPDTEYGDAGAASESGADTATEEELAEEAEEIALTEKVLSHHDEDSPQAVEEKIVEVEQDVPEKTADDPETLERTDSQALRSEGSAFGNESHVDVSGELEPVTPEQELEPTDARFPNRGAIALDAYEGLVIHEGLTGIDEPLLDRENEVSEPQNRAPGELSNPEGQPQTASVREGGRYMHRLSRRMRRRRGGNRFSTQSQEGLPEARGTDSLGTGAAAGIAAALAPEVRGEPQRKQGDDRALETPERVYPSISDLLKPGQEIIVQIAKEPLGQKGARITSHIALPGRYVVFMPSVGHLGVSRKVASDEERQRLKRILQAHRPGTSGGFIVRTAGEGVSEEEIAADMNFLYNLWLDIRQKAEKKPAPALLHYDLDVVQRILRDQVTDDFKAIWVDNEDLYENVVTFMQRFQPALVNRVKMYTRSTPIFDAFNITQELEKALRPKVWLKSGGYIVINQTEALVAIDINTGKYVGKSNRLEDTIVKTNTEAVKEIVRQIRLRDLGGIIVVDFIDMDERKNRQKVMQALEEAMRADKAPYKILQFNDFGLVAITRKRVKQSLERALCSPCPYCEGAGYVKSVQTVISEILIEAQKISRAIEGNDVVLRVHPDVAKVLKASDNQYLEELEEILRRPVLVNSDPTLHHQKFDLA
ncbi:MAG: Rne/Rng family ribonuclease, partial [Acidobacteriaceae bacterium]|nr:Rne/Rng family ribonuclease [Acidobacteriaceae bacterium]